MQPLGHKAFGVSLRDLAASGQPPVVLQDCLRWLALRGLTTPRLFTTPPVGDKRKLLALRHLYDTGRRPLRSKSCRDKDPHLIANLLLLWLGQLPEPLFPAALVPELVQSQQSDYYEERLAAVRALLKRADAHVVEALFPLFELLHHYWINQEDRDTALRQLGALLAPPVFGTPARHGLPPQDGGLLSDTVEMLVSEYRPLFTQPFNLRRYEADAARQAAAAAAQAAEPDRPLGSPLLTPIRCERLSVMHAEGASPFSDCCGTPLAPESPVSAFLASAVGEAAGGSQPATPAGGARRAALGFGSFQAQPSHADVDMALEQTFSDLLESTVSGMLFDCSAQPDACAAAAATPGAPAEACPLHSDVPISPTAVLREMTSDAGDSSDGSDCDAPRDLAGSNPFAWPRNAACGLAC